MGVGPLSLRFGILGSGFIGKKRALAIREAGMTVTLVADPVAEKASALAAEANAKAVSSETLLSSPDVDAVVVATTNNVLASLTIQALRQGKHVLVEKPAGRNPKELNEIVQAAKDSGKICRIGYNHRFHPALLRAKALVEEKALGEVMYLRARYGHGGRIGYDKEWRADPELSGGGELIDQGVHLIDLARWYCGEMSLEFGTAQTLFWNMPVDDNAFVLLKSANNQLAWLHASCTEWKNTFDFEIFCRTGKIHITGLGRSYGPEEMKIYRVKPEMGIPDLETLTFPENDASWTREMEAFRDATLGKPSFIATPEDGARAVALVSEVYGSSRGA